MKGKGYLKSYRYAYGDYERFSSADQSAISSFPYRYRSPVCKFALPSKPSDSSRYSKQMPPARAPLCSMMKPPFSDTREHLASCDSFLPLLFVKSSFSYVTIASRIGLASGVQQPTCLNKTVSIRFARTEFQPESTCSNNFNRANVLPPSRDKFIRHGRNKRKKKRSCGNKGGNWE